MKKSIFIKTPYNHDTDEHSLDYGLACLDETRTQQHQAKECDINYIVQQFGVTGMLPQSINTPTYQDFESVFDYQTALNAIIQADEAFASLPAELRKEFEHSPAKFLDFLDNNPDPQKLVDLGIAEILQKPAPPSDASIPT